MSRQTTEKIKKGNYSFEKTGDNYPKNVFRCHFFKVGTNGQRECGAFGENAENKTCCSEKKEIMVDYKICCTKHEGNSPDKYLHCQTYLEKMGNMSDKERRKLEEMKLTKVIIKMLSKMQNKPWIKIVSIFVGIVTIIGVCWGFWTYYNPRGPGEVMSDPELGITNIFIDYLDENMLKINELDINSEVNLDEVDGLLIYFELRNIGDPTIVLTVNKILIKTSSGDLIVDYAPENFDSRVLSKGLGYVFHYIKGIKSLFVLNQLEQNHKFKIIVEPDVVYFEKGKIDEPKKLDSIIECHNSLDKELLPKFKFACSIGYRENQD